MDYNDSFLVATVFDKGARTHGPVFCSATLATLKRNCEVLLKETPIQRSEFLVFVHGEMDMRSNRAPFQPYMKPVVYSAESWAVLDGDAVELEVEEAARG